MAASLRKMGVFFGLTEDDAYADAYSDAPADAQSSGYDQSDAYEKRPTLASRDEVVRPRMRQDYARMSESPTRDWSPEPETGSATAYTAEYADYPDYPEPSSYRITTLHPRTYNEAVQIGEHFRAGTPVIMNLTEMADSDAKRLVDFAAGLTFGLHGRVERVTSKVFLLSPPNVTVTAQDKARIAENGFFNQS